MSWMRIDKEISRMFRTVDFEGRLIRGFMASTNRVEFRNPPDISARVWMEDDGKYHREEGPAIEWSTGTKEWWVDGKMKRMESRGAPMNGVDHEIEKSA